jgi:hypothetical protein
MTNLIAQTTECDYQTIVFLTGLLAGYMVFAILTILNRLGDYLAKKSDTGKEE